MGIKGTALEWFRSYLADETFSVCLDESVSSSAPLSYGVPQGSILVPLLFSLYMRPLGLILRQYNISFPFHCYASDSKIYVALKHKDPNSLNNNNKFYL